MKRLAVIVGTTIAALVLTAASFAARTAVPNNLPDAKMDIAMWADTVYAANANTGYKPVAAGQQDNFFPQGAGVTFRMSAVEMGTGKVLTAADMKQAYIVIPNQPIVRLAYGPISNAPKAPSVWTGTWLVPADYAVGVVDLKILVRTKTNKLGIYKQIPVASSQLTIAAKPA